MSSLALEVHTFSEARANLKAVLDRAADDQVPVVIARRKGKSVVIHSLEEWNSWQETLHLNSTAANRQALDEGIAQAERGDVVAVELGPDGVYQPTASK